MTPAPVTSAGAPPVTAADALALARRHAGRGEDAEALWIIERIIDQVRGSERGEAHYLLALLLVLNGHMEAAGVACAAAREHGLSDPACRRLADYAAGYGQRTGRAISPDDMVFFDLCRAAFGVGWQDAGYHVLLARIYMEKLLDREATACCAAALAIDGDLPSAHFLLSFARLRSGDVAGGWRAFYDWMAHADYPDRRAYMDLRARGAEWDGGAVGHLLMVRLFGNGDVFQFVRYLGVVSRLARKITLVCPSGLRAVLAASLDRLGLDPTCTIALVDTVQQGEGAVDAVFCLDFLPWLLIPAHGYQPLPPGYLRAGAEAQARSPQIIPLEDAGQGGGGLKIGVCWATGTVLAERTMPVDAFFFLGAADVPFTLISLQQPPRGDDLARLRAACPTAKVVDPGEAAWPFEDLAALIARLDLVVTVDTGVAHLAAAQGVPTWVLLRYAADWRHFDDHGQSRWYPSMRLFHQERPGDIASAVRPMAAAWTSMVERHRENR